MKDETQSLANKPDLVDMFSRTISYLRLSLTDRCNLRCMYCMPLDSKGGLQVLKHEDLLSYEELLRIVGLVVPMGMNKIRLTGGEPLVRKGVMGFIAALSQIDGLDEIRLTTNGVLLKEKAAGLYAAGIRKLNISLDTLRPERFKKITGLDLFDQVWQGIEAAVEFGFDVKLNVVAMRDINDDELIDFAGLAVDKPYQIRFIEFMPVGRDSSWDKNTYISSSELKERIGAMGTLEPLPGCRLDGPARMYSLTAADGATGRVGFISPISHHFCDTCNRLRLTSAGRLRACLLHDREADLKALLRSGGTDDEIRALIKQTILDKPKGHTLAENQAACSGQMSRIGG
ncbi:MAG: GTP 3',8-cyclase MoaA [Desulfocapsa sp.]|nr:GTP 3',8-cyclase MoaA [Desulfocapsa sp.]